VEAKVARFFFSQHTKTGGNVPNDHKIYQTVIEHIDIFRFKGHPKLYVPNLVFLVCKHTIWQPRRSLTYCCSLVCSFFMHNGSDSSR
jgi:hypothetical protein